MLSRAARRLGRIAATTPATAASTTAITRLGTGTLNTLTPWFYAALGLAVAAGLDMLTPLREEAQPAVGSQRNSVPLRISNP